MDDAIILPLDNIVCTFTDIQSIQRMMMFVNCRSLEQKLMSTVLCIHILQYFAKRFVTEFSFIKIDKA